MAQDGNPPTGSVESPGNPRRASSPRDTRGEPPPPRSGTIRRSADRISGGWSAQNPTAPSHPIDRWLHSIVERKTVLRSMYSAYRRNVPKLALDAMRHFWSSEERGAQRSLRAAVGPEATSDITVAFGPVPIRFTMCFDLDEGHDLGQFWLTRNRRLYEPEVTRWIVSLLGRGDTFVDVGGNNGYYSMLASKVVGPTGRVLAFEPNPAAFSRLLRNRSLNAADNVSARCLALSDRKATASLFLDPDEDGRSTMVSTPRRWQRGPTGLAVPTDRLDRILDGVTPRLVKIDVEGHELPVLRGMEGLVDAPGPPCLIVEWNPQYGSEDLLEWLLARFDVYRGASAPGTEDMVRVRGPSQLPLRQICNLLCRPKDDRNRAP